MLWSLNSLFTRLSVFKDEASFSIEAPNTMMAMYAVQKLILILFYDIFR